MTLRLTEIDALRGIAIVMMIAFHSVYYAWGFALLGVDLWGGFWGFEGQATRFLFLGLVGVGISLSSRGFFGQLKRAAWIFVAAMLVSFGSWIFAGEEFVRFGILHLIAVSIPIVVLFKGKPFFAALAAILALLLGEWFEIFKPVLASYLDYFPLFPWIAVIFFGLVLGENVYGSGRPTRLAFLGRVKGLVWLGRHSLAIYLLHIPVIYSIFLGLSS